MPKNSGLAFVGVNRVIDAWAHNVIDQVGRATVVPALKGLGAPQFVVDDALKGFNAGAAAAINTAVITKSPQLAAVAGATAAIKAVVDNTAGQVATIDANTAGGTPTPDEVAQAVADFVLPTDTGPVVTIGNAMLWVGCAARNSNTGYQRYHFTPNFVLSELPLQRNVGGNMPDLTLAGPGAVHTGESDLQMLQRVYPAVSWSLDSVSKLVHGTVTVVDTNGNYDVDAVYDPSGALTLAAFKSLWDYTPASGPPERNGIEDSMSIFALLPIQY